MRRCSSSDRSNNQCGTTISVRRNPITAGPTFGVTRTSVPLTERLPHDRRVSERRRFTDTNSANDSKGRAFGLEGNDFVYVLVALVGAIGLYLVFAYVLRTGLAVSLLFSVPLPVVVAAWVLSLRHNKPEGYAEDVFDDFVNGEGWSLIARAQSRPPGEERHAQ